MKVCANMIPQATDRPAISVLRPFSVITGSSTRSRDRPDLLRIVSSSEITSAECHSTNRSRRMR